MQKPFHVIAGCREDIKDKVIQFVIEAFVKNDEENLVIVFKDSSSDEIRVGNRVEFWAKDCYLRSAKEIIKEEDGPLEIFIEEQLDEIEKGIGFSKKNIGKIEDNFKQITLLIQRIREGLYSP